MIQFEHRAGILDLSWGHPRPDLLPVGEWASAGAHLDWRALTYGAAAGPAPLLESLGDPDRTFSTGGASHGLSLVTQILTSPGDVALIDSPTYHLAFPILADRGLTLVQAPTGLDPAALTARIRKSGRRVSLLYLVPTFGNPTGDSLPDQRRRELIEVARREGMTIVEDDTYRELAYDGAAPASLWELAGGGPVVRLGSFAKTVAPGLRLGWINAEPEIIRKLTGLGYVNSGGGVNHTTAMTMAAFRAGGGYQEHVSKVRGVYRTQRNALVNALREHLPGVDVPMPAGGWFVWLPLPDGVTADALLPLAESSGVSFVPGTRFWAGNPSHSGDPVSPGDPGSFGDAGGSGRPGADRVRLSFSHLGAADLERAAERLAGAVAESLHKR